MYVTPVPLPPPPPHTHSFPLEGKQQACAAQCIPQLVRLLSDRDSDVRAQAAGALMRWARHFREQGSMNVRMYVHMFRLWYQHLLTPPLPPSDCVACTVWW